MTTPDPDWPGSTVRPTRADARRNYDRLLAAANEVFAEQGADAPLDVIARRAGLGSGTLYRHFPTRDLLMTAVFRELIETLCARGDELADTATPADALTAWLRGLIEVTTRRRLASLLLASRQDDASQLVRACRTALTTTLTRLLTAAQRTGSIRTDLDAGDLLAYSHAVAAVVEHGDGGPAHPDHLLDLLVNGLRTR
ncbi:MAG: TetR/AcrR family transcriptional regulator [Actinocatenispora sp.]